MTRITPNQKEILAFVKSNPYIATVVVVVELSHLKGVKRSLGLLKNKGLLTTSFDGIWVCAKVYAEKQAKWSEKAQQPESEAKPNTSNTRTDKIKTDQEEKFHAYAAGRVNTAKIIARMIKAGKSEFRAQEIADGMYQTAYNDVASGRIAI